MNGDRMLDLSAWRPNPSGGGQRIAVSYWPLCGLGRYADERRLPNAPGDTFEIGNADLRDVFVDDITGDGLADVLVLDGSGSGNDADLAGEHRRPTLVAALRSHRDCPATRRAIRPAHRPASGRPECQRLLDLLFRNTSPANA